MGPQPTKVEVAAVEQEDGYHKEEISMSLRKLRLDRGEIWARQFAGYVQCELCYCFSFLLASISFSWRY
jgi:hypothetical protein